LITGGAGFVGSHLADALIAAGASHVVALDNLIRGSRDNLRGAIATGRCELVEGDVRDRDLVSRLTAGCDYVFHEAALRITACVADPRAGHEVMLDGTFNVIEAAAQHGVKKLVAASSASVYGEPDSLPIEETAAFNNRTLYGGAKLALEQYLRAFHDTHGLRYVALRYFNLYGPRMDLTGVYTEVLIRWLDRLDAGLPPLVYGTGEQAMDFVYVADCVRANLLALQSEVSDDVFNVATGVDTSLLELCRLLLDLTGHADLVPEFREERQAAPVRRRRGGTRKAREQLGFESQVDLRTGLSRLIEWRRDRVGRGCP
jgi:UDP-glucose 4-epimerase